jgi:GT2 family glycosyltransferase
MNEEFSIMCPSNRPNLVEEVRFSIKPYNLIHFDGSEFVSFSKLMNHTIINCPTEICIICNDKARPIALDIDRMLLLIGEGYGMVQLFCFGFFGFRKELFRRVGFFDERLICEEREDSDFVRRMKEKNIGYYEGYEVTYIGMPSSWTNRPKSDFYFKKWQESPEFDKRLLPDEQYNYDLGNSNPAIQFKEFKESFLMSSSEWFRNKPLY